VIDMMDEQLDVLPWYRQRWPWYIIGLLSLGVFGSGILVVAAIEHKDPLVVDDYYKEGLAINRTLDRQRAARTMGLEAQVDFDASNGILRIHTSAREPVTAQSMQLRFVHATLANLDYTVDLIREDKNVYLARLKALKPGTWDVMLEPKDKSWRLDAHLRLPAQNWKLEPEL